MDSRSGWDGLSEFSEPARRMWFDHQRRRGSGETLISESPRSATENSYPPMSSWGPSPFFPPPPPTPSHFGPPGPHGPSHFWGRGHGPHFGKWGGPRRHQPPPVYVINGRILLLRSDSSRRLASYSCRYDSWPDQLRDARQRHGRYGPARALVEIR